MFTKERVISPLQEFLFKVCDNESLSRQEIESYKAKIRMVSRAENGSQHSWLTRVVQSVGWVYLASAVIVLLLVLILLRMEAVSVSIVVASFVVVAAGIVFLVVGNWGLAGPGVETSWVEKPFTLAADADLVFNKKIQILLGYTQADNSLFEMVEFSHPNSDTKLIAVRSKANPTHCYYVHARNFFERTLYEG